MSAAVIGTTPGDRAIAARVGRLGTRTRGYTRAAVKSALKQGLVRINSLSERLGVHVQPVHYYSEVPDRRALARDLSWARPYALVGVAWDLDKQLAWVRRQLRFLPEVVGLEKFHEAQTSGIGPGFGPIESQLLHCVIRTNNPRRIVEIGSGVSTLLSLAAVERNAAEGRPRTDITCVEPFPWPLLRELDVRLLAQPAQQVSRSVFEELEPGDILFIDSSHTVRTGSEVPLLYLDIVPRLRPGVLVHIHDIALPYLFLPDVLRANFDWQETTVVAALLTGNPQLRVLASLSALFHDKGEGLCSLFPDMRPWHLEGGVARDRRPSDRHFPSSLWLITGA